MIPQVSRRTFTLGSAAALSTLLATGVLHAADEPAKPFIAHEWGTFSTVSGSDGKPLKFVPNDTDLPSFVFNRRQYLKGGLTDSLVSLETPVLYFYTDRDRTVSVRADFPQGSMTDWYPQASRPPMQQIRWDQFQILANDNPTLPVERGPGRYYAAREVDAATVKITDAGGKAQYEKFLFYRGVGDATMPLTVNATGRGSFLIKNTGRHDISHFLVIDVNPGRVTYKTFGKLEAGKTAAIKMLVETGTLETVSQALVKMLQQQGLYEKEAKAMVKTWQADWFGETGTRVLYLVAEKQTAELLPLEIEPKPDQVVRVLVGRHDVITPEREREIDRLVTQLHGRSNDEAKAADAALQKMLGRYRSAAQTAAEKRLKIGER